MLARWSAATSCALRSVLMGLLFSLCLANTARSQDEPADPVATRKYSVALGFQKKKDVPVGEFSWLTVVSPEEPDGVELVLEPDNHPAVKPFRNALVEDGIPWTSFAVEDVQAEYDRLTTKGVRFLQPPVDHGSVVTAVLDDTCGNLIQIAQEKSQS